MEPSSEEGKSISLPNVHYFHTSIGNAGTRLNTLRLYLANTHSRRNTHVHGEGRRMRYTSCDSTRVAMFEQLNVFHSNENRNSRLPRRTFFSLFHRTANLHGECDLIHLRARQPTAAAFTQTNIHTETRCGRGSYLLSPSQLLLLLPLCCYPGLLQYE